MVGMDDVLLPRGERRQFFQVTAKYELTSMPIEEGDDSPVGLIWPNYGSLSTQQDWAATERYGWEAEGKKSTMTLGMTVSHFAG